MAAEFVEITLEEMERFLKRAFRVMRPKQGIYRGIYYYDLRLSDNVVIRVYTSISAHRERGKDVGEGAIRIGLFPRAGGKPLKDYKGKLPIVKRTQNWKSNLQNRIEDEVEAYDDREDYWEHKAGKSPDSVTPGQLTLIRDIVEQLKNLGWGQDDFDRLTKEAGVGPDPEGFTKTEASQFIEALSVKRNAAQKAKQQTADEDAKKQQSFARPPGGEATFRKLRSGDWGIQGMDLVEGEYVDVVRKNGSRSKIMVGRIVWQGSDGTTIAEIDRSSRKYASELLSEDGEGTAYEYDRSIPA